MAGDDNIEMYENVSTQLTTNSPFGETKEAVFLLNEMMHTTQDIIVVTPSVQ
jgi:hypothetical protein